MTTLSNIKVGDRVRTIIELTAYQDLACVCLYDSASITITNGKATKISETALYTLKKCKCDSDCSAWLVPIGARLTIQGISANGLVSLKNDYECYYTMTYVSHIYKLSNLELLSEIDV